MSTSLTLTSQVIGFLSFGFTLFTAIGVYADLFRTLRGAPSTIPIALGNLREEIKYEQRLCQYKLVEADPFHVFPGRTPGKKSRNEFSKLLAETLRHLWLEFCEIEKGFLIEGDKSSNGQDSDDERESSDEKNHGRGRRRRGRPQPAHRETYIRGRMGWVEAGLAGDRRTYYNTDLSHRFSWWWKKDDVNSIAEQVQRLQIRRIERDSYESNELVKRALRKYGRRSGDDVYTESSDGNGPGRGGGSDSDGGGGGGPRHNHQHRRRHSGISASRTNGVRRARTGSTAHGRVREVSEKEVVRRRAPSPKDLSPPRRPPSLAGNRQTRPSRGSVVYEYEVVDPGRIHVEYESPRQNSRWQEGRQRSYSRPRDRSEE